MWIIELNIAGRRLTHQVATPRTVLRRLTRDRLLVRPCAAQAA